MKKKVAPRGLFVRENLGHRVRSGAEPKRQGAKARAHRAARLTATTRLGSDWLIPRNNAVTLAETPPSPPGLQACVLSRNNFS